MKNKVSIVKLKAPEWECDDFTGCYYISQIQKKAKQNSKRSLTIGTWNVRGLRSKINEIEKNLEKKESTFVLFS